MGSTTNQERSNRQRGHARENRKHANSTWTLGRVLTVGALIGLFVVALTMVIVGKRHKLICTFTHSSRTAVCKNKQLEKIPDDIPKTTLKLTMGDKADKSENRFTVITRKNFTKLASLRELVLIKCGIEEIKPMAFADLKNIRKIDLRYNHIQSIDEETFKGLIKLDRLELSNNPIKSIGTFAFRGMDIDSLLFGNNPTLETLAAKALVGAKIDRLVFDRCKLNRLHLQIFTGAAELKEVHITNNKQTLEFPDKVFMGMQLEKLVLTNNGLTDSGFLEWTETKALVLDGNVFSDLDADTFTNLSMIQHLSLARLQLSHIPKYMLSPLRHLTRLNLEGNNLGEIPTDTFTKMKRLKHLNLSNNKLSQLRGSIYTVSRSLESLYLDGNEFQSFPESAGTMLSRLETLAAHNNPFHCNCEMRWFAKWMDKHPRIILHPQQVLCQTPTRRILKYGRADEFKCSAPVILNATLEPDAMSLICTAEGDPAPHIRWESPFGDTQIGFPPANRNILKTESALIITKDGEYTCHARNLAGETGVTVNTRNIPKSGLRFAHDSQRIKILETPAGLLMTSVLLGILGYTFRTT